MRKGEEITVMMDLEPGEAVVVDSKDVTLMITTGETTETTDTIGETKDTMMNTTMKTTTMRRIMTEGEATKGMGRRRVGAELTTKTTTEGMAVVAAEAAMTAEEEEEAMERRPFPEGEMFDITTRSRDTGETLFLTDPGDRAQYERELATVRPFYHGGEVEGPGTGTSDSVPARLSDGEFVMTAKAVRGAGGGDRDIGAARMYDMMAELEAQA